MSSQMSRRSFLKSLSLLPLIPLLDKRPNFIEEMNSLTQNQGAPNVLILVFDTLSAPHMSVLGYHRETTPNLARFAERATVYHRCYSSGNYTTPGTASLLTGTYPWSHRAFNFSAAVAESYKHRNLFKAAGGTYNRIAYTHNWRAANVFLHQFCKDIDILVKPSDFCLRPPRLADQAFPDDVEIAWRSEKFLLQGKDSGSLFLSLAEGTWMFAHDKILRSKYASLYPRGIPGDIRLSFLLEDAIDGIKDLMSSLRQPFLGYFHLFPPHEPYRPRREFIGLFTDSWTPVAKKPHFFSDGKSDKDLTRLRRDYDEYLAYADAEFGRLYDFMEQTGLLDNTYVIFTSDHGQLFERGIHGHSTNVLYEPVILIPLIISKPGQRQREDVYTPTSCVDILPTFLQVTGQAIPDWCEGKVLPTFGGKEANSERSIFSIEARSNPKHAPLTKGTVAMIKGQYKLIHYFGYDGYRNEYELYDLVNDPEELEDLYLSKKSIAAELQSELERKLREVNQPYLSK